MNALPATNPTPAFVVNKTSHISKGVVLDTVAEKLQTEQSNFKRSLKVTEYIECLLNNILGRGLQSFKDGNIRI